MRLLRPLFGRRQIPAPLVTRDRNPEGTHMLALHSTWPLRFGGLAMLLANGCSASSSASPPSKGEVITRVGTLIYANNDLQKISLPTAPVAFVSRTVGLTTVELIQSSANGFRASEISAPPVDNGCNEHEPVALAVGHMNDDRFEDVLVSDPCGSWVAFGSANGDFTAVPWSNVLPPIPAFPFLMAFETSAGHSVLTGTGGGFEQFLRVDGVSSAVWVGLPNPTLSALQVTNLMFRSDDTSSNSKHQLIVQGYRRMVRFSLDHGREGIDATRGVILNQSLQRGYFQPFEAFDHIANLGIPACPGIALGVGLVASNPGTQFPRRLQRLLIHSESFDTEDLPINLDAVTSLSILPRPTEADALVFVVGQQNGKAVASLWVHDCNSIRELSRFPIEFDWRTPHATVFGPGGIPRTNGVKFVAQNLGTEVEFLHYDGYDVRAFRFKEEVLNWTGVEEKYNVHMAREDVLFQLSPP